MIGYHIPFDGFSGSLEYAKSIGLPTFQIFIRNNRNSKQRDISEMDIAYFNSHLYASGITSFVVHEPYVMNPASGDAALRQKSVRMLQSDLLLLQKLFGVKYMVVHPGASTDYDRDTCMQNLFKSVRDVLPYTKGTKFCIETMAGCGTQLMSTMDDIRAFVEEFKDESDACLCLDTCHLFGAGILFDEVMDYLKESEFKKVGPLHLNGSMHPFGSRKDRHDSVHHGYIPYDELTREIRRFQAECSNKPIVLEMPEDVIHTDWLSLQAEGIF